MERKARISLIAMIILTFTMLAQLGTSAKLQAGNIRDHAVSTYASVDNQASKLESGGPAPLWNRTYGGTQQEYAFSLVPTSDNGFVLAGGTFSYGAGGSDFWLVRTDSLGNMQWNRTYGGTGDDEAHCITLTLDGGYAILGTTNSFGAGGYDFWLVKTDSAGNPLWNKTYGGAGDDDAWSIKETVNGDLVLAGWTASFGTGSGDFWLVKTNQYGNMLWNKTYGGVLLDYAYCVQQTSDGGYALFGSTYSLGAGGVDFWLVKTDAAGNEQWNKTYGGALDDYGFSSKETFNGGYALAGSTSSFGEGVYDSWLVRTDQSGNVMWNKTYGASGYDETWSVLQAANQGFILAGGTDSYGAGSSDCWLIAADASGNLQWNITWGGTDYDYAYSVLECADGNFALAGETQSFGVGGSDFLLIKVPVIADVAVTNATALKAVVGQGYCLNISMTVANEGDLAETFNVTVYANISSVASQTLTLASGKSIATTFTWNTSGFAKGNYAISAYAEPVPGETDTTDNNYPDGWVVITVPGDLDGDFKVQLADLVILAKAYDSRPGDTRWNPNADIDGNSVVGLSDLVILANHYGQHFP